MAAHDGETLHIHLHERLRRHELPPPPSRPQGAHGARPREPDLDALLAFRTRYEWRPTGLLTLGIDGLWYTRSVRRTGTTPSTDRLTISSTRCLPISLPPSSPSKPTARNANDDDRPRRRGRPADERRNSTWRTSATCARGLCEPPNNGRRRNACTHSARRFRSGCATRRRTNAPEEKLGCDGLESKSKGSIPSRATCPISSNSTHHPASPPSTARLAAMNGIGGR